MIINRVDSPNKMGLDISAFALARVNAPTVLGSASDMPFQDMSYEVVIASELLEHIPEEEYHRSLQEIARVASKWIVVTVPNRENLKAGRTRCPKCGSIYQASLHLRSYNKESLGCLFPGFTLTECMEIGDTYRPLSFLELFVRQRVLHQWTPYENTFCPSCGTHHNGSKDRSNKQDGKEKSRLVKALLWLPKKVLNRRKRIWIAALYCQENSASGQ